jgi:hypothetical protein
MFVYPYMENSNWIWASFSTLFMSMLFFSLCWLMDPGYL